MLIYKQRKISVCLVAGSCGGVRGEGDLGQMTLVKIIVMVIVMEVNLERVRDAFLLFDC